MDRVDKVEKMDSVDKVEQVDKVEWMELWMFQTLLFKTTYREPVVKNKLLKFLYLSTIFKILFFYVQHLMKQLYECKHGWMRKRSRRKSIAV